MIPLRAKLTRIHPFLPNKKSSLEEEESAGAGRAGLQNKIGASKSLSALRKSSSNGSMSLSLSSKSLNLKKGALTVTWPHKR